MNIKTAFLRTSIVLVPSYAMAFLTEKMVYVVPMLAASSFFAAAVGFTAKDVRRRVDEDDSEDDSDDIEAIVTAEIVDG